MAELTDMTALEKTYLYLENYGEMQRYIKEAVYEADQIRNIDKYNISAEKAYLSSIRTCKAETVILFEHINVALDSLKRDAEAAGEAYKYNAFEMVYVQGKTYEDVTRLLCCGKNSPKKWSRAMMERLSIKLFGVMAIL